MSRSPERAAEARRTKRAALMRQQGTPLQITASERAELREHLTALHRAGMSHRQIADSAPGYHRDTTVYKIVEGRTASTHRDVYNDLMRARWVQPTGYRRGSRVHPCGVQRRLRALVYAGFSCSILGELLDVSCQAVYQLINADRLVAASTVTKIDELYGKLAEADPKDYGATNYGISRARNTALRRGWEPVGCWDPDTIDDPEAYPEWTGQCGSQAGYRIHRRENIPVCRLCRDADDLAYASRPPLSAFSPEKFKVLRERHGLSQRKIALLAGVDSTTIIHWESGRSKPSRQGKIDAVLSSLGARFEDVCEEQEKSR